MVKNKHIKKLKKDLIKLKRSFNSKKLYQILIHPSFKDCSLDYTAFTKIFGEFEFYTTSCVYKNFSCKYFKYSKIISCTCKKSLDSENEIKIDQNFKSIEENVFHNCINKILKNNKNFIIAYSLDIEDEYKKSKNVPILLGKGNKINIIIPKKNIQKNKYNINYKKIDMMLNE